MNKYYPVLFIRFSGTFVLKKIACLFSFLMIISIFISFNSVSAQWVNLPNPASSMIFDVYFLNQNTGWMGEGNGGVFRTTNGGSNWTGYAVPGSPTIFAITFIDINTGFAASTMGLYKTTNSGINWSLTDAPSPLGYNDVLFINSNTGWAVNNSASFTIVKTTNGGDNWFSSLSGTLQYPQSVYFADVNTGWACGLDGFITKTTNSGTNWVQQTIGNSDNLHSICFTDANTGYMTSESGKYYKTTNGGSNWASSTIPGTTDLYDNVFINQSTGWTAGWEGVHFTSNGGSSWIHQTAAQLRSINITSLGVMYAAGNVALKTTTGGFNLPAPSNLTATPASTSQINLSWTDNSIDEDKFMIERREGEGIWGLIDSVGAGVTSYQSTGMTSNVEYQFRVYAKRLIFTSGYSNTAIDRPYMIPPTHLSPANGFISASATPTLSWSTVSGGIIYYLQVASDTNFSNIVYSTDGINMTSANIPGGTLQNSTRYYWHVRVTNFSNESMYSAYWSFVYQNPNYGNNMSSAGSLYYFANSTPGASSSPSQPTYNWRDTTGSTSLILNGVLQIPVSGGNIDDGRFDLLNILPPGNSIRFFGTNYQSIYVGTNGIIGVAAFTTQGPGYYEPLTGLPQANIQNAIFPLWKDFNFGDAEVPVNRLSYKVTPDELIITYLRAPNYNTEFDVNDYVSFQVIIKHSSSPAANSKIEVMYNYDQTGSSFITKYNNNTLEPNLIGLQASNSAAQIFLYRYLNAADQLMPSGPMFGSNLALAMGPDQNTLPVELASFTSEVNMNNVQLNWSTVSEENNSGFEIERCELSGTLGVNMNNEWKKIGNVQGGGTTNETRNYSYEDRNVQSGNYKYRLKQIDYNGNFEYHDLSSEVNVGVPTKFGLSQNYPNPFNPSTKINFEIPNNSKVVLQVYDITGRMITELVNKQMEAGYYTVDFNASNLSSGIYFYRLAANDFVQTKKMLLVK